MIPSQIHPSLRPSIRTRLVFIHPLFLPLTTFAAVLYAFQHSLQTAPSMPWAPAEMPIEWTTENKRSPAGCWASTTPCYPTADSRQSKL